MEEDVKVRVELYKNYQYTGLSFYKACCMEDLIHTYTCLQGPVTTCPFYFDSQCMLCSRLACLK